MSPSKLPVLAMALLAVVLPILLAGVQADTLYLKDGTHIPDCQVVSTTESMVYVRTPVGDMGVPREKIRRIHKQKTPFDNYEEKLARIRKDDVKGLFRLATWCRGRAGLRKESDALAATVFELDNSQVGARRLLGHIQVGKRWYVPRPLSVLIRVQGATGTTEEDVRQYIEMFLGTREDVRVVSTLENVKQLDAVAIELSATVTRKAQTRFYGTKLGKSFLGATVALQARSDWSGRAQPKIAVHGAIPAGVANASAIAVKNAVGSNERALHHFLDHLLTLRAKAIHKVLSEKQRARSRKSAASSRRERAATTAKPAKSKST